MTRAAPFRQSDVSRLVRGAIKGGLPANSFQVVFEGGRISLLPIAANTSSNAADEAERRMRDAFNE